MTDAGRRDAVIALHYQNENCHPDGKIKVGIADGAPWREERLANARRLFAGARAAGATMVTHLFNAMRRLSWWRAPLVSSTVASTVDTLLFFGVAFAGTGLPWVTWAAGDYAVKLLMALLMLLPFRVLMRRGADLATAGGR